MDRTNRRFAKLAAVTVMVLALGAWAPAAFALPDLPADAGAGAGAVGDAVGGVTGGGGSSGSGGAGDAVGGAVDDVTDVVDDTTDAVDDNTGGQLGDTTDIVKDTTDTVDQTTGSAGDTVNDTIDGVTGGSGPIGDTIGRSGLGNPLGGAKDGSGPGGRDGRGSKAGPGRGDDLTAAQRDRLSREAHTRELAANLAAREGRRRTAPMAAEPAAVVETGQTPILEQLAQAAGEAARKLAFPLALTLMVLAFLTVQGRIDGRDAKLALAPIDNEQDFLSFQ